MRSCTILLGKVWSGWYMHAAIFSMRWLLILGIILSAVGIVLNYLESLAEIGTR